MIRNLAGLIASRSEYVLDLNGFWCGSKPHPSAGTRKRPSSWCRFAILDPVAYSSSAGV